MGGEVEREREKAMSVLGESGDLFLSHILFWWEVWSLPICLLTSDTELQLDLFQVRYQDSDLRSTFCTPISVHCLSHSLRE